MRRFLKSFGFAFEGIVHGFKSERNFKIHVLAATIVVLSGILTKLSIQEWIVIYVLIAGMLALELLNTAVERVIDLITSERHPLAKQAKDLAAGAVLIYALASAIIGFIIFIPKWLS